MKDLYDAIEALSAQLALRIERCAKKRGYAVSLSSYSLRPQPGRLIRLHHTLVSLPGGYTATFAPRDTAEPDGETWLITIKRSDGVVRGSYEHGLLVRRTAPPTDENGGDASAGETGFAVHHDGQPIYADHIERLLDDLQKPAPTGVAMAISRIWNVRFGRMPMSVVQQLDSMKNAEHLDLIYDALLDQRGRAQIDELLAADPAGPPRTLKDLPKP
jgi:hypothetical protein